MTLLGYAARFEHPVWLNVVAFVSFCYIGQAATLADVVEWAGKLAKSTLTGLAMLDNKPVAAVSMAAATKDLVRNLNSTTGSALQLGSRSAMLGFLMYWFCHFDPRVAKTTRASVQRMVPRALVWRAIRVSRRTIV